MPSGRTAIGSSPGSAAKRASSAVASGSVSESTTRNGIELRSRKPDSRVTSGDLAGPIRTGPPKPISISATRRRMSARRMRSPSSASAMSSARSDLGLENDRLHVAHGPRVDRAHVLPSGELPELGHDLARHDLRHLLERRPDQLRECRRPASPAPGRPGARWRPGRTGSRACRGSPRRRERRIRRRRNAGPRRRAGRGRSRRGRGPGTSGGTATPARRSSVAGPAGSSLPAIRSGCFRRAPRRRAFRSRFGTLSRAMRWVRRAAPALAPRARPQPRREFELRIAPSRGSSCPRARPPTRPCPGP